MSTHSNLKSYEYNVICDVCGFKMKNGKLRKRWDGFMVCAEDWEERNILDFYQTANDSHLLPWTRPDNQNTLYWTPTISNLTWSGAITNPATYYVDPINRIVNFWIQIVVTSGYVTATGSTTFTTPPGYTPAAGSTCIVMTSQGLLLGQGTVTVGGLVVMPSFSNITNSITISGKYGY